MRIKVPQKYLAIWRRAEPVLKKGRKGDLAHCGQTAEMVFGYIEKTKRGDLDVLIPTAMMHDIGHAAILPEHMKFITGPEKLPGGKLVHMLAGAKIASDILKAARYNRRKAGEIVDIISMHDADQLPEVDKGKVYDTLHKRLFHDIDSLDRYTQKRVNEFASLYGGEKGILDVLERFLMLFFFDEFKNLAAQKLKELKQRNL